MTLERLRAAATVQLPGGYHTWPEPRGKCSITLEDGEFLYALVRMMKPKWAIEVGTGLGVAAQFIGEALKANGDGWLTTYESFKEYADQAREFLKDLPVAVVKGDCPVQESDLVLIDSAPGSRLRDINEWVSSGFGDVILVHDANRDYDELKEIGLLLNGSDGFWIGGRCA